MFYQVVVGLFEMSAAAEAVDFAIAITQGAADGLRRRVRCFQHQMFFALSDQLAFFLRIRDPKAEKQRARAFC